MNLIKIFLVLKCTDHINGTYTNESRTPEPIGHDYYSSGISTFLLLPYELTAACEFAGGKDEDRTQDTLVSERGGVPRHQARTLDLARQTGD